MKKRIAVLAGGNTGEDVISHRSAGMVMSHIDRNLYDPWKVIFDKNGRFVETEDGKVEINLNDFSFDLKGETLKFDKVFVMIHGDPGENGRVQGYFDLIGMPYSTGGVLPMALTAGKFYLNAFLRERGFHCAKSILHRGNTQVETQAIVRELGLPVFVKPNNGGSSLATSRCDLQDEISEAVSKALEVDHEVIIEEFLPGTEVTSGVIVRDGRTLALPLTEILSENKFFDFEAKYEGASKEITPARISAELTSEIQEISSRIFNLLDCRGMIRIDYIIRENKPHVVEVNTVPGFSEASIIPQQAAALGISKTELITMVLEG